MRLRRLALATVLGASHVTLAVTLGACAHGRGAPALEIPEPVGALTADNYAQAVGAWALMAPDDERRGPLHAQLIEFRANAIARAIEAGEHAAAMAALEALADLYGPSDLAQPAVQPRLAAAGKALYRAAASQGREAPALLALALTERTGTADDRAWANAEFALLVEWSERTTLLPEEGASIPGVDVALEEAVAIYPSPWLAGRLELVYRTGITAGLLDGTGALVDAVATTPVRSTDPYAHYRIARLRLRMDDLDGAIAVLDEQPDPTVTRGLREILVRARARHRKPNAWEDVLLVFDPREHDGEAAPRRVLTQGWAILGNLAQRARAQHPKSAIASLALGRVHASRGWDVSALALHRYALAQGIVDFDAWQATIALQFRALEGRDQADDALLERDLAEAERLYARAAERFSARPITPNAADLYLAVAFGRYRAGQPARALELLARAERVELSADVVGLRADVHRRLGALDAAKAAYTTLLDLPFSDQYERVAWEIEARSRLGEIALAQGDPASALAHLQTALQEINLVLGLPGLGPESRAPLLIHRARVLVFLGERDLATDDLRDAISAAPDDDSTYADPLLLAVQHGLLPQATEVWRSAMRHGAVGMDRKCYFTLWYLDLAQRSGAQPDPKAVQFLRTYRGRKWLEALAAHALGTLPYADLLARARDLGERAEAHFYEGLRLSREGKDDAALRLMQSVIDSDLVSFYEYEMARQYLRWREVPKRARATLR